MWLMKVSNKTTNIMIQEFQHYLEFRLIEVLSHEILPGKSSDSIFGRWQFQIRQLFRALSTFSPTHIFPNTHPSTTFSILLSIPSKNLHLPNPFTLQSYHHFKDDHPHRKLSGPIRLEESLRNDRIEKVDCRSGKGAGTFRVDSKSDFQLRSAFHADVSVRVDIRDDINGRWTHITLNCEWERSINQISNRWTPSQSIKGYIPFSEFVRCVVSRQSEHSMS
jgi:hypothetical protein